MSSKDITSEQNSNNMKTSCQFEIEEMLEDDSPIMKGRAKVLYFCI